MPLFNKFTPLEDESLKTRVQALMQRAGFTAKGFFVMDGSRRSAHSNAFFTGFGASKRVVFFDTLLQQLSPSEMEAVLAHELGHFKYRHIVKMMVTQFAMTLAGLALLGWLAQQVWFYVGLGVMPNLTGSNNGIGVGSLHVGGACVFILLGSIGFMAITPTRVRSRCVCRFANPRTRPGIGVAQALPRQCLHIDARSLVCEVLLLASARQCTLEQDARSMSRSEIRALKPTEVVMALSQLTGWSLSGDGEHIAIEKSLSLRRMFKPCCS